MKVYYYSMTGNTKSFLEHSDCSNYEDIKDVDTVNEPFIIATGTVKFGEAPQPVIDFIEQHKQYLQGVISSGNRNWGPNFAKAGDVISEKYNVPLIMKFELRGTQQKINEFNERMKEFDRI